MSNTSEQFDVLSNALRVFPEEILRLGYFIKEVNDPEEGISNVEIACVNVFNQLYGMMCAMKDDGHISSIYEHHAITTILCMRHVLQHKAGRIKNNLRDAFKKRNPGKIRTDKLWRLGRRTGNNAILYQYIVATGRNPKQQQR